MVSERKRHEVGLDTGMTRNSRRQSADTGQEVAYPFGKWSSSDIERRGVTDLDVKAEQQWACQGLTRLVH